jgi:beta-lactam-binding protein with PASTA domain
LWAARYDGPGSCYVPKVRGLLLAAAKAEIRSEHCTVGRITRIHSSVRAGHVVRQSPKAGKTLAAWSRIKLVVSRGPKR